MLRHRSTACPLFVGLLFCMLSCTATTDAPTENAGPKPTTSTTKGVVDIEKLERPDDATQLVGKDKHILEPESKRGTDWTFENGVLTASTRGGDSLLTPETYKDFVMYLDFNVNHDPEKSRGGDGNSGVYIQQRYEIQILNSYGVPKDEYKNIYAGSIYKFKMPDKLVNKPAGEWQSYVIVFRAARFDGDKKKEDARVTVYQNGELIHDDVTIPDKTGRGLEEGPEPLPIRLQGHGNAVKFRNVWVKDLNLD